MIVRGILSEFDYSLDHWQIAVAEFMKFVTPVRHDQQNLGKSKIWADFAKD